MCPNVHQNLMLEESRKRTEALARVEAEQARQAALLANLLERIEVLTAERPKRSVAKP